MKNRARNNGPFPTKSLLVAVLLVVFAPTGPGQENSGAAPAETATHPAGAAAGSAAAEAAPPSSAPSSEPDENALRVQALQSTILGALPPDRHFRDLLAEALCQAYAERGFRPLWSDSALPESMHRTLSKELVTHGYPDFFALDPAELASKIGETEVDAKDLALSVAILDTGLLARIGIVPAEKIWDQWNRDDTPGSDDASVESIVKDLVVAATVTPFDASRVIDSLAPKNWIYRELRKAYPGAKEAILKYSGLPVIPDPSTAGVSKPGEVCSYAPAIAAHLADRGYLAGPPGSHSGLSSITPELEAALIAFQKDYGLDPDGVFGPASWRFLSATAADRYRSLSINLHRARLLPDEFGDRYVIANLPCAELYLFEENDFHIETMRIVHGKASKDTHHTPIFRDVMQEVVFGPYWNVPPSIARKEVIPKAQEDWGFLSRNRYEIVSDFNPYNKSSHRLSPQNLELVAQGRLFLRQKPGPTNALGHIKFLFPNSHNVYMHDTPAKSFFARSNRDYSHGCIRVSKPEELGAWVLKNQDWTREQVKEAMHADSRKSLPLENRINVYITYLTTFPRPVSGGKIVLAPGRDVYQHDDRDARTLAAVIPWNRRAVPVAPPASGASAGAPPQPAAPAASGTGESTGAGTTLPSGAKVLPDGRVIVP